MSVDNFNEVDDETVSLSERIARYAYIISITLEGKSPEVLQLMNAALSLLNQAQFIVGKNDMLAVKLFNQARRLSRKSK